MDIGRSFKYMFEDQSWITKVLIGGILGIIPIVNFVTYGYLLLIIRNVSNDQELPLPDWDDFGGKFMKGLMVFLASLIYALPIIVLSIVFAVLTAIVGAGASNSGRDASGAAGGIIGLCAVVYYCVLFLYSIVAYGFLFTPGMMRYAEAGEFGVFFQFAQNWGIVSSNLGGYIVMILVAMVAGIAAEIVGAIACGIGIIFTMFWACLVAGHLMGQYWKESRAKV